MSFIFTILLIMAVPAVIGGWVAARFTRRLSSRGLRWALIFGFSYTCMAFTLFLIALAGDGKWAFFMSSIAVMPGMLVFGHPAVANALQLKLWANSFFVAVFLSCAVMFTVGWVIGRVSQLITRKRPEL